MPLLNTPPSVIPGRSFSKETLEWILQDRKNLWTKLGALAFVVDPTLDWTLHTRLLKNSSHQADCFYRLDLVQDYVYVDRLSQFVCDILDNGAVCAFTKFKCQEETDALITKLGEHAADRLGLVLTDITKAEELIESFDNSFKMGQAVRKSRASTRSLPPIWILPAEYQALDGWLKSDVGKKTLSSRGVLLDRGKLTIEECVSLIKLGVSIVPENLNEMNTDFAELFLAKGTSDRPDGLFPTAVVDESGILLGQVFSSRESIVEMMWQNQGVYFSRKRGLWHKGAYSGDTQTLVRLSWDCDYDCLMVVVKQNGRGFCHLGQKSCFGRAHGLDKLQSTLLERKKSAPAGSYTARLFSDRNLLRAKLVEEATELAAAETPDDIAFEAADLIYFALVKCASAGVTIADIEQSLDQKSAKISRRRGDAKPAFIEADNNLTKPGVATNEEDSNPDDDASPVPSRPGTPDITPLKFKRVQFMDKQGLELALRRPAQKRPEVVDGIVRPIIQDVRFNGDKALLKYTHQFEKATSLTSTVMYAPFDEQDLPQDTQEAIETAYKNIKAFHSAQQTKGDLQVVTMRGVTCRRLVRPIETVGIYIPGGTAVLPSTALMLGVPAQVAKCDQIVIATPPRADGSVSPEIVFIAKMIGASHIVLAGGAQAVAALAYGTETVPKVDKILGPGNQFVTAAKMIVSNDTTAAVSIDMPAGPSEVMVIADEFAKHKFIVSDMLSQAEHGEDSQVILVTYQWKSSDFEKLVAELEKQLADLPRAAIARASLKHASIIECSTVEEAYAVSNQYAPEHLILQCYKSPKRAQYSFSQLKHITNAGSVFLGDMTPESVGDYSAGVNHSLPTYGYAKQYSGVNLDSFQKHITATFVDKGGIKQLARSVMKLAEVEGLEAHRRAVQIRLDAMTPFSWSCVDDDLNEWKRFSREVPKLINPEEEERKEQEEESEEEFDESD